MPTTTQKPEQPEPPASSTTTSGNESVELDNENPPPYTTTPTQPLRELLCAIATVVVGGGSSAAYCYGLRLLSMASNRQLIHLQRERELSIIINSDGGEYILEDVLSQEVYFLVQCKCHLTL